jgi:hypothetical protein
MVSRTAPRRAPQAVPAAVPAQPISVDALVAGQQKGSR